MLRIAGLKIGTASNFWGMPTLLGAGPIHERLRIGTHCGFNKGCFFDLDDCVTLGDHVAVGHDVMFITRLPHLKNDGASSRTAPIVVQNGVWLGARCTILPGVTIGAGSVIAAGTVVAKDIPENTLFTGKMNVSLARWR